MNRCECIGSPLASHCSIARQAERDRGTGGFTPEDYSETAKDNVAADTMSPSAFTSKVQIDRKTACC